VTRSGAGGSKLSDTVHVRKKVFASICDTPLGLMRTLCPALGTRPPIASLDVGEEGLVHILTSGPVIAQLTMPELLVSSRAFMPATPAVARIQIAVPISWRPRGELCPQSAATADVQGGRVAGFGDNDVTYTKFSTCLGPPSCSPPV
jgi:hypothetical protein